MANNKNKSKYSNGVTATEFKGNMILSLPTNSKYPFSFGVSKAKMILDHIKDIELFVDEYGSGVKRSNGKSKRVDLELDSDDEE